MTIPPPPPPTFRDRIARAFGNPIFTGIATLIGLILAVEINNLWIRIFSILTIWIFCVSLIWAVRPELIRLANWLTRKFWLGLVVGAVIGGLLSPIAFQPLFANLRPRNSPQIFVLESDPSNGGTLLRLDNPVEISFSRPVPEQDQRHIRTEITPPISIRQQWIKVEHTVDCCRHLHIYSIQAFTGSMNTRFEADQTYYLRVSGPILKESVTIEFHTPPE